MGSRVIFICFLPACAAVSTPWGAEKMAWPETHLKEPTPIVCDDIETSEHAVVTSNEPQAPVMLTRHGLRWPVFPRSVTSHWGVRQDPIVKQAVRFHRGMDVSAGYGATVYAALPGRVLSEGDAGGHGHRVTVDHGNGVMTSYSHLALALVAANMWVEEGQPVGIVGDTGRSTGPHLHFEVAIDGETVDPFPLLGGRLPEANDIGTSFSPPKLPLFQVAAQPR
jgi:murein DD-endopeptidase MepM/ murein hydrolase activator NlpD